MADFNWKDIAGPLAKVGAPVLGTLIGGPAGAAMGKVAGEVLAGALGVPAEPEAVAEAIAANPDKAAAIANSPDMAAAIEQAHADMLKTVNETYRMELQQESWVVRYWRPACGWCLAIVWTVHGLAIGKAIWLKEFEIIKAIADLMVFYIVMGGVTGTAVWGRTKEKLAGVNNSEAMSEAIGAMVKRVAKK